MIRPLFALRRLFVYACAVLGPLLALSTTPLSALDGADEILIFSHTAGFRHDSIPAAVSAISGLGDAHGFAVHATEDRSVFNDQALDHYRAVVFLNTTGDILDPDQEAAFQRFIQRGGGFVGIHAAADTEIAVCAPAKLAFIEAHGTGTALGDPTELRAACEARGGITVVWAPMPEPD